MHDAPSPPSSRRAPSMADVAAVAGVSHQTVSRVLNDSPLVRPETRERVQAAIVELGYRRNSAARALARNRSGRLGMLTTDLALHGPSMTAVAVQEAGYAAGYDVTLVALDDLSERALRRAVDRLLDQSVEAVVVAVAHRLARERVAALDLPVPVVLAQGVEPGAPLSAGIDQVLGSRLATEHLLDLGHRRVAHVAGPLDWIEAGQRRVGWREAHADRGQPTGPELAGDWSAASGYAAGLRIAEQREITAVVAGNDAMALGVLRALRERGLRVPEDVSLVGFDDVPEAAFYWPPLTTVRQAFAEVGTCAVDLVLRCLGGETSPSSPPATPVLVQRESTSVPRPG